MSLLQWIIISYVVVGIVIFRSSYSSMVVNDRIKNWGEFWASVLFTVVVCTFWLLWLPLVLIQKSTKLLLGDDPAKAAAKLGRKLEVDPVDTDLLVPKMARVELVESTNAEPVYDGN